MKTVQLTIDDDLAREVDRVAKRLGTTRSAFTRETLREAVKRIRVEELEQTHREGYLQNPSERQEFAAWEAGQVWPDDD